LEGPRRGKAAGVASISGFEGQFYKATDVTIYDRPENPVPIYIAAGGPVMAK
jgi:hypothetical protein